MKNWFCIFFLIIFLSVNLFPQGVWTQKASFPGSPRGDAFSFSIGNKGYLGTGSDYNSWFNDLWEYDAINNSWVQKNNFAGVARWQTVSFSIGVKGYIGVGQATSVQLNDFWEYDPSADSWTQKASIPTAGRNFSAGFSIGNKGYIGTGLNGTSVYFNDLWEYDVLANAWTQKANFPGGGRLTAVGLSIGTKGYIGLGKDNTGSYNDDFWEYDFLLDTWTQKSNFAGGKREEIDGAHFVIGNYGYLGTGRTYASSTWTYYNDFWRYNPANDTWTQIPNLPATVRVGASNFSINNKGYIGLGFVVLPTFSALNDLWEYSFDSTSGVNEIESSATIFNLFPNPSTGKVTFQYELPKGEREGEIILYNLQGGEVKRYKVDDTFNDLLLDNTQLQAGTYFYQLQTSKGAVGSKKMVVVK